MSTSNYIVASFLAVPVERQPMATILSSYDVGITEDLRMTFNLGENNADSLAYFCVDTARVDIKAPADDRQNYGVNHQASSKRSHDDGYLASGDRDKKRRCKRTCGVDGCATTARSRSAYCQAHGGGPLCLFENCTKNAIGNGLCAAHGGGKRCQIDGCTKSARGKLGRCIAHGGGERCKYTGCPKSAQGTTGLCVAHGMSHPDRGIVTD